jgi:hypothetical protein
MKILSKARLLKPTATIHIANRFSLVERKVLNSLIWNSQRQGITSDELAIEVDQVFDLIGFGASKNVVTLKDALRRLVGTTIEWNVLGQDRSQEWGVCTFLSSAKVGRGLVHYRLNPEIAERIRNPTLFAKIQLLVQTRFTSKHSLVFYEYLIDCLSRERSERVETDELTLETVYRLLGFAGEEYGGSYKFFNRDVLKPSFEEINRLTDIEAGYTAVREQRRVCALRFTATRKASYQLTFDLEGGERPTPLPALSSSLPGPTAQPPVAAAPQEDLVALLVAAGVGQMRARSLVRHYDGDRIRRNLRYAQAQDGHNKPIKNMGAYVVRAIEEDYVPAPASSPSGLQRRVETPEEMQRRQAAQKAAQQEELRRMFQEFRYQRCRELFAAREAAWRDARQQSFIAKIQDSGKQPFILEFYRRSGFESPIVEAAFFGDLLDEMLTAPEETLFEAWVTWREQTSAG